MPWAWFRSSAPSPGLHRPTAPGQGPAQQVRVRIRLISWAGARDVAPGPAPEDCVQTHPAAGTDGPSVFGARACDPALAQAKVRLHLPGSASERWARPAADPDPVQGRLRSSYSPCPALFRQ